MAIYPLVVHAQPDLTDACMVLGFTGWMDGGDVSTGTLEFLRDATGAQRFAEIEPDDFYLYHFPASMEVASLLRPHGRIDDGLVRSFKLPSNTFYFDKGNRLVLFSGHEPNIQWRRFSECVFAAAEMAGVSMIYFVGSVGGVVPHTREPRLFSSVSSERIKQQMQARGLRFTNYEGPLSLITYMMTRAEQRGMGMATIVAEIPAYVQGRNPKSIAAVLRQIGAILDLSFDLDPLRQLTEQWESRLNEAVKKRSELASHIQKLEEDYDNDVFDTQMGDLKSWLQDQGIRVD